MASSFEFSAHYGLEVPCFPIRPISPQFSAVLAELESEVGSKSNGREQFSKEMPTIEITDELENRHREEQDEMDDDSTCEPAVKVSFDKGINCESNKSPCSSETRNDVGELSTNEQQYNREDFKTCLDSNRSLFSRKSVPNQRRGSSPGDLEKFKNRALRRKENKGTTTELRNYAKIQSEKQIIDLSIDLNTNATIQLDKPTRNEASGAKKEVWHSPLLQRRSKSPGVGNLPNINTTAQKQVNNTTRQSTTCEIQQRTSPGSSRRNHLSSSDSPTSPRSSTSPSPTNGNHGVCDAWTSSHKSSPPKLHTTNCSTPLTNINCGSMATIPKPPGSPKPAHSIIRLSPLMTRRAKSPKPIHNTAEIEHEVSTSVKNVKQTENVLNRSQDERRGSSSSIPSPVLSPSLSPEIERKFRAFSRSIAQCPTRKSPSFDDLTPYAKSLIHQASSFDDGSEEDLPTVPMADVLKTWNVTSNKDMKLLNQIGLRDRAQSEPVFKIDQSLIDCRYLRRRKDEQN